MQDVAAFFPLLPNAATRPARRIVLIISTLWARNKPRLSLARHVAVALLPDQNAAGYGVTHLTAGQERQDISVEINFFISSLSTRLIRDL
jgi:hypothetical protein